MRATVEIICYDFLLRSIVEIICSDYLLRLSAEISCYYYLLRSTVEAICCDHLLCAKSIKKPMSIPSKTRKDQKAHEHSSNPCQKVLKPMSIASKTQKPQPRPEEEEMLEWRPPALTNTPLSHAHTASPRPLARTHDTNTKRNRNQFPDWGSPASIISPQSPIWLSWGNRSPDVGKPMPRARRYDLSSLL